MLIILAQVVAEAEALFAVITDVSVPLRGFWSLRPVLEEDADSFNEEFQSPCGDFGVCVFSLSEPSISPK